MAKFADSIKAIVQNLTTADKVNFNKVVYEKVFGVTDLIQSHQLITDVHNGQIVPVIDKSVDYGQYPKSQGNCAMNDGVITERYSTRKWNLVELNGRHSYCMKDLDQDFMIFWNQKKLTLDNPLEAPDYDAYIDFLTEQAVNNLKGAQWRQAYLGDTSHESGLINGADGYFAQAEAGSGEKITITKAGAEATAQEIYDAMAKAYDAIVLSAWFDESKAVIKMTRAMAHKLVSYFNSLNDTRAYDVNVIDGEKVTASRRFSIDNFTLFGINVEVHKEIDFSMNAVGETNKLKALITSKDNLVVGTPTADRIEEFEMFFDQKDKKIYIDLATYFGVALSLDDYALIS
ncbi:hypothetical protein HX088_11335 [Empedobacter sp. 225-1]|uniref:hypothetical protein n=1 Tax=Empedobacter sp. 225-1 TaxID=2746725 RepID=UPI0025780811|nr:hypothetical protein [Empedobacter sp. 225-1]MDM1523859.1 hypothetical protein [Empedobacter sp. 225-1]